MLRFLAKLCGILVAASIAASIASAVAALNLKRQAPPRPDDAADEIDLVAVMDGAEYANRAPAFRGGRVICWYAGAGVDLREATLDPGGADLEVRTVFGGTRIVVAPGVPVDVSGPAIFSGISDMTAAPEAPAGAPALRITGFTVFGGLQIIAAERGEELAAWATAPGPFPGPEAAPA